MGPGDLVVPTVPAGARSGLTVGSHPELCRGAPVSAPMCRWTGRPEWRTLPGAATHRETEVVTCPSTS